MRILRFSSFACLLSLMLFSCTRPDDKQQFANCFSFSDYALSGIDEFPDTPTRRTISFGNSSELLSVEKGFRYTYNYQTHRFMDVAIEYPGEENYSNDTTLVSNYFDFLARANGAEVEVLDIDGLEGYEIYFTAPQDKQKFLSIACLFDNRHHRIAYVYFRKTGQVSFNSSAAFAAHQSEVLKTVAACLVE